MIITVNNTTLFNVAAQWFSDATQWNRIATLNNLSDPMITGTTSLILPPPAGGPQSAVLPQS